MGLVPLLAACQASCPLSGQVPMIALKLYFGRDIPGGGFVTDQAWSAFAARALTPAFPDGFTAYEAQGQWRDPQDGRIAREKSFVVEIAGPLDPAKVTGVVSAYKNMFRQVSVGEVTQKICGSF